MSNNVYTQVQINALVAAGIDLNEFFGATPAVETVPAPPAVKVDGRNHEARKHNHDARIARRSAAANAKNAKGLTKAEKSALYAELRERTGNPAPTKASWTRIVAAFKDSDCATVAEFIALGY